MAKTADVVIIGGGVHGVSLAFHLAKAKAGKVILLDKEAIGSGPTAKSGAMVRPLFGEAAYIELVLAATTMLENWDDVVGGDAGFVQKGFLRITDTVDNVDVLGGDLPLMKRLGVPHQLLPHDSLRELVPTATFVGNEVGLLLTKGGYADPLLSTTTLAAAAKRLGAEIMEGVAVTGITTAGGRIQSVQTSDGDINTSTLVNCAGPWSARLASMVGIDLPIETHRVPTCLFRKPPAMGPQGPILSDGVNQIYLRAVGDSILRAARFGWTADPVDPDNYDETITPDKLNALRNPIKKRYQVMNTATFTGGFSAIYDMTPDAHPIIGHMPQQAGFWCNCGWSGNGFASAPVMGQCLADQIMGKPSPIDISAFQWPRPTNSKERAEIKWVYR
jgi:sarcosine oxidase subunit beta